MYFNHVGTHSFHFLSRANNILHLLVGSYLDRLGGSDENRKLHAPRKSTQGKLLKSWFYMILRQTAGFRLKKIIIHLPPWQGVVSVFRVICGIIDRWIQARPSANKYMSCIRTFSIFANSHSLFCAKYCLSEGNVTKRKKNIHKEDSCFGYAAISICNRGGKHAHSYPRQCSDLLLTLKMDLPDIRCLVHANCYGK